MAPGKKSRVPSRASTATNSINPSLMQSNGRQTSSLRGSSGFVRKESNLPNGNSSNSPMQTNESPPLPRGSTSPPNDSTFQVETNSPLSQASNADVAAISKGRGPTRGIGLNKLNKSIGKKLPIEISLDHGRPLNRIQSAKLSSQLGMIAREYMPMMKTDWRKIKPNEKQIAYARLEMNLDVINLSDNAIKDKIDGILKNRTKDTRYRWHQRFLKWDTYDEALKDKPKRATEIEWENLCKYWSDPKVKERCGKNAENRSMLKILHNQGSMAFVAVRNEIEQKELNGEECDRITFFKRTHYKEGKGWVTAGAEEKFNEMQNLLEEPTESGTPMNADEICDRVLGTRSGYIKGLGYGPKPKRDNNSSLRLQELEESIKQHKDALKESQAECNDLRGLYNDLKAQVERQAKLIDSLLGAGFNPPAPSV